MEAPRSNLFCILPLLAHRVRYIRIWLITLYCCLLSFTIYGCSTVSHDGKQIAQDDLTNNALNADQTDDKARDYLRVGRYLIKDAEPSPEQKEPLLAYISINLGEHIYTIGDALFELLRGSGYRILYKDVRACQLSSRLLFDRELPLALRTLGPMTLLDALETVVGKAWQLEISELGRTLSFHTHEKYADDKEYAHLLSSRSKAESNGPARDRFTITFNTGEFHAPMGSALQLLKKAAKRITSLSATVLIRGHAHSSGHWATESQALRRAKTVRDILIKHGVNARKLRLETSVSNNNDPLLQTLTGVELFLYTHTVAKSTQTRLNCASIPQQVTKKTKFKDAAPVFTVEAGSLRKNVERLLKSLNLRMGKWDLADGRYEYDWEIPHSYTITMNSPDQTMRSLLASYGIQPILNLLDSSVDFVMHHKPVSGRP